MDYLQAIALGIIQGITEWLPVSSSGHLALLQNFFGVSPPVIFDIMLHLGTLAAVTVYFRNDLLALIKGFFTFDRNNQDFRLALLIVLASLPTAIIGFGLKDFFASMFSNTLYVGIALLITGAVLFSTRHASGNRAPDARSALIMGIVQGCAVAPGISRSGTTISAGMLLGLDKEKTARFSFLMFIPAIIGATIFEAGEMDGLGEFLGPAIVGTVAAAITGYLAIGFLLRLISANRFSIFAYYCFALGLLTIILSV
ncbi:TPA: undecaprenyl-diphosphate phosphatase [Candidatus Micrarchaeota archaeon]|nr:undecaprenyl-diphosphate phosphatase [Candidatus Micrarchaeota archaeon]